MNGWQPIKTAPKNMRHIPGGSRPIEIYAEWAGTGDEWAIAEWDNQAERWVQSATDEPLVYANNSSWAKSSVWWRPLRDPPTREQIKQGYSEVAE